MAININTILEWFKTGKKPTEQQFADTWHSFWHKDETIPQATVENLDTALEAKANQADLEAHINDPDAHGGGSGDATTLQQMLDAANNSLKATWNDGAEGSMNFGEKIYNSNVRGFEFTSKGDGTFIPAANTIEFSANPLSFGAYIATPYMYNSFAVTDSSIFCLSSGSGYASPSRFDLSPGVFSFSSNTIAGTAENYGFNTTGAFNITGVTATASKDVSEFQGVSFILDGSTFNSEFYPCQSLLIDPNQTLYQKYGDNSIQVNITANEEQRGYYYSYAGYFNDAYVWTLTCDNEAVPSEPTAISFSYTIQDYPNINFDTDEFKITSLSTSDANVAKSELKVSPGVLSLGIGVSGSGGSGLNLTENFNWGGSGTVAMNPNGGNFSLGDNKGKISASAGGEINFDPSTGVSISGNAGNVTINGASGDIVLNGGGQRGKTVVNNGGLEVKGVFSANSVAYMPVMYSYSAYGNNNTGQYNYLDLQEASLHINSGDFTIYGSASKFNIYLPLNMYGAATFYNPPIGASYFGASDAKSFVQRRYVDDAIASAGGWSGAIPTLDNILSEGYTSDSQITLQDSTTAEKFVMNFNPSLGRLFMFSDTNSSTLTNSIQITYGTGEKENGYHIRFDNSNGVFGTLYREYLTQDRSWRLRDKSGDIAFTDEVNLKANAASPVFTGTVTIAAPTANTTGTLWLTRNATTGVVETTLPGYALSTGMTTTVTSTAPSAASNIVTNLSRIYGNLLTLRAYAAKTAAYTITAADDTIDFTGTTIATATLLTAVGNTGKRFTIKNSGTGVITIATTSSQTIDGATTFTLPYQYTSITVQSDGANWKIVSVYGLQGEGTLSKNAAYTISVADYRNGQVTVFADASASAVTITLEASASMVGKTVNVIKTDTSANTVTIKGNGTTNINAANTLTLSSAYQAVTVKSNSTQYYAIQ